MKVLVVGAGPAGLVTAITLGRLGVPTTVIERRTAPSPFPRATGISLRSMEIFRSWGLEEPIRAGEMDVGTTSWIGGPIALGQGMPTSLGFPNATEARAVSPTRPAAAPQDHLEPVLLEHLRGYPSVDVRFGVSLVDLRQDEFGVTARLDSVEERFDYVVGADGAHSAVRSSVDIPMEGSDDLGAYYTVIFRSPLAQRLPERHGLYLVPDETGMSIVLPTDRVDRWVFAHPYDPSAFSPLDVAMGDFVELIRAATGVPDLPVDVQRVGAFTFAAQVAARYRSGRVFLVGDAAHRTTPRGGTGMNTAIQDGLALGWRLGWIGNGWAGDELLESYEDERRPVGLVNTARSAEVGPRDNSADWLDDLGGRIPHAWVADKSTLDLLGDGLTLLTGPAGRPWAEAVSATRTAVPVEVHGVDGPAAVVLGIGRAGAVLVRPDAIPIARWSAFDPDGLATALAEYCCAVAVG
jgi:putative polyketide hydroxylase